MKAAYPLLALLFAGNPLVAHADASLRSVLYHFSMDSRGFSSSISMGGPYGGNVEENGSMGSGSRTGTIRLDVIRATQDGGLVVDVTEQIDRRLKDLQTVRCAVYGKSQDVICDQNLSATPEETVLLQYVGRFFYDPAGVDASGQWHTSPKVLVYRNMTIDNQYTVTKTDGDILTVKIDRSEKGAAYSSKTDGTLLYDARLDIPDAVKIATTAQRASGEGDMNLELKLLTDSMAPATNQTSHQ
ncbi:MAG: hypothetical protein JO322_00235 [Candidatus Eremiobacteraeota bacterium]|nr:hypothetical protein [Candidatus Eremiobacteraeota bacterium]